jgi:hypothetical protein
MSPRQFALAALLALCLLMAVAYGYLARSVWLLSGG